MEAIEIIKEGIEGATMVVKGILDLLDQL